MVAIAIHFTKHPICLKVNLRALLAYISFQQHQTVLAHF